VAVAVVGVGVVVKGKRATAKEYRSANTSEIEFQRQLLQLATTLHWLSYHTQDSRNSAKGFPDLVLVRRGRLIFAELKKDDPNSKPTDDQAKWLAELGMVADRHRPVEVYLWRPHMLDEIQEILK
jgi:VRR-NUC domain